MSFSKEGLLKSIQEKMDDFNVTYSDLQHPTSEFMMTYFTHVLLELGVDIKVSIINQRQGDLYSECYRDTNPYVRVYLAIREVCAFPNFLKNFSIMSIMDPKPEDIYYVAVVDNFHSFVWDRMQECYQPLSSQLDRKQQLLEELKNKKEEMQQRMNDAAAQRSRRENDQRQVDKQIEERNAQLAIMQERLLTFQLQFQCQEAELIKLRQHHDQLKNENDSRFLWETLQKKLTVHQQQLAVLEEELREKSDLRRQKASLLREFSSAVANEEKACTTVEHIVHLVAEAESTTSSLPKKEQQLTELRENEEELKLQQDKMKKKVEALQIERASLENHMSTAHNAYDDQKKKLEELFDVNNPILQNCHSYKTKNDDLKRSIASLKGNLKTLWAEFAREYKTLEEKMNDTFDQFTAYVKKK